MKYIIATAIFILTLIITLFNQHDENIKLQYEFKNKEELLQVENKHKEEKQDILNQYLKDALKKLEDDKVQQKYYKRTELEIGRDWDKDYPTNPNGTPTSEVK